MSFRRMTNGEFQDTLSRLRNGDDSAVSVLMEAFGPELEGVVRVRAMQHRIRSLYETSDVLQSVWLNFVVRARLGAYDLDEPTNLLALLLKMARNKITEHLRRPTVRTPHGNGVEGQADRYGGPVRIAETNDTVQQILKHLPKQERQMAVWRSEGRGWNEIGKQMGIPPGTARMRLSRAVARAAQHLGLEDLENEPEQVGGAS